MLLREDSLIAGGSIEAAAYLPAPGLGLAELLVARHYRLPLDALQGTTRGGPRVAEARQVAMYLGHVVFRLGSAEIARGFGRDRTTARHACRRVEQRREDPTFDRRVTTLEQVLRELVRVHALWEGRP